CMTILIGWRLAGIAGAIIALVGLLLPSVTITIVMTGVYASLQRMAVIQTALHGVVPATIGLGLMLAVGMARPLLLASEREGRVSLIVSFVLLAGSGVATAFWHLPVIVVLCGAGVLGGLAMWWRVTHKAGHP